MKKWKWILEGLAECLLIALCSAVGVVIGMFLWGWLL